MDHPTLLLGGRIMAGATALLIADLFTMPWHRIPVGAGLLASTSSRTGVQHPNGSLGLFIALVALFVLARVVLGESAPVGRPDFPAARRRLDERTGIAPAVLVLLKLGLEPGDLAAGAFLAVLLAGAIAYGSYLRGAEARFTPGGPGS